MWSIGTRGTSAWFVDASNLGEPELLAPTVVSSLGLDGSGSADPIGTIAAAFADRDGVLALDNLEQLSGAGEVVSELLDATPRLRTLTTSRTPLGVRGEIEVRVTGLELPVDDSPAAVTRSPAGSLFLLRAKGVGYDAPVDVVTAGELARLLRALDGMPLAIELAAARTRLMSPGEILRRLDQDGVAAIDAKGAGSHGSLSAIVAWTLGLLNDEQTRVLHAASYCAGFDLPLLEELVSDADAIEGLESLVSLGLVQRMAGGRDSTRFRVLETIRVEVRRRMDPPSRETVAQSHADAMAATAGTIGSRSTIAADVDELVAVIDLEADNLRLALDWFDRHDIDRSLQIWHDLAAMWATGARFAEGMSRFEDTASAVSEPTVAYARAIGDYMAMANLAEGAVPIHALSEHRLEVARSVDDTRALIDALTQMLALGERAAIDRRPSRSIASCWHSRMTPSLRITGASSSPRPMRLLS